MIRELNQWILGQHSKHTKWGLLFEVAWKQILALRRHLHQPSISRSKMSSTWTTYQEVRLEGRHQEKEERGQPKENYMMTIWKSIWTRILMKFWRIINLSTISKCNRRELKCSPIEFLRDLKNNIWSNRKIMFLPIIIIIGTILFNNSPHNYYRFQGLKSEKCWRTNLLRKLSQRIFKLISLVIIKDTSKLVNLSLTLISSLLIVVLLEKARVIIMTVTWP